MANPGSSSNPPQDKIESEILGKFLNLPDDLFQHCLARVPRSCYSSLPSVSKLWQNQIRSQRLYSTRKTLKAIDFSLCIKVSLMPNMLSTKWYEFFPPSNYNTACLFELPSLLPCIQPHVQPHGASVVSVGTKIYIIGGMDNWIPTKTMWVYDLVSDYQWDLVESQMTVTRYYPDVAVLNNKIYVMGGCKLEDPHWVEVFDPKTRKWSSLPSPYPDGFLEEVLPSPYPDGFLEEGQCETCVVVMKGKIFYHAIDVRSMLGFVFVLDTSSNVWTKLQSGIGMPLKTKLRSRIGNQNALTVIDDVLYRYTDEKIQGFDYEKNEWKILKLREGVLPVPKDVQKMVNMNGRLVGLWKVSYPATSKFHCAVIEIQKTVNVYGTLVLSGSFLWAGFFGEFVPCARIVDCVAVGL